MILLDTNVLVYALTDEPRLGAAAADLVGLAGRLPLRVTGRTIEEFAHVFARRQRGRDSARARAAEVAEMFGPAIFTADEVLAVAIDLWVEHDEIDIADAVLAATAIEFDAHLVSADKAFASVPGLKFVDLADPDISEVLALN